jgi:ribonuclease-3
VLFRTKGEPMGAGATRSFRCTVLIDGLEVGHGVGSSKKEAEQRAAQSVSHEPSDEECARLLDRLDKMSK